MHSETPVVSVIRRSSRLMVRELGFMGSTTGLNELFAFGRPYSGRNCPTKR